MRAISRRCFSHANHSAEGNWREICYFGHNGTTLITVGLKPALIMPLRSSDERTNNFAKSTVHWVCHYNHVLARNCIRCAIRTTFLPATCIGYATRTIFLQKQQAREEKLCTGTRVPCFYKAVIIAKSPNQTISKPKQLLMGGGIAILNGVVSVFSRVLRICAARTYQEQYFHGLAEFRVCCLVEFSVGG